MILQSADEHFKLDLFFIHTHGSNMFSVALSYLKFGFNISIKCTSQDRLSENGTGPRVTIIFLLYKRSQSHGLLHILKAFCPPIPIEFLIIFYSLH